MQKWHCCSQNKSIVRVGPGGYRLFCLQEPKVTQECSCMYAIVHHMITTHVSCATTSTGTQLRLMNGRPRICGIFGGPPEAGEMYYTTFGNIWPWWCFVFVPATFVWGRISGMLKVMERWRSHLLEGLALGTGQLDGAQQDQALSIGFKCPPCWFNSLAWQAPLCGAGKCPVPLYWIAINSKLLKMVENILWTARDSALRF